MAEPILSPSLTLIMKKILKLSIVSLFLISQPALAQEFGKNKVRYERLDWQILETEHFDLYYTQEDVELAKIAAAMAEGAYKKISVDLKHNIVERVPFILFGSHYEFQQTNIITELIERWVGGFAEIFKHRMVIPFTGSFYQLNHVITHELTHVFTYDILYSQNPLEGILSGQVVSPPPMWFMEGLAEYEAGEMTAQEELVLADAVFENRLIPFQYMTDFNTTDNPYLCYRQSQSLFQYIAQTYGKDRVHLLLKRFKTPGKIDKQLTSSLGVDIATLEKGWQRYLQQRYYPRLAQQRLPTDYGQSLLKDDNASYSSPVFSPGGDMVALIKDELGYASIFTIRVKDGQILQEITKGMKGKEFEEIKLEKRALSWSQDGTKISFIAKKGGKDAIFIYDLFNSRLSELIHLKQLDELSCPSFSPDGRQLALCGLKNGSSRIYILNLETKGLTPLTSGGHLDAQPCWSPAGDRIAFVRDEFDIVTGSSSTNILLINPQTNQETRVTQKRAHNDQPFFSPDGKTLLFSSDASGIPNLYAVQLSDGTLTVTQITDCLSGAVCGQISSLHQLIFASYYHGSQQLYLGQMKPQDVEQAVPLKAEEIGTPTIPSIQKAEISDYKTKLTFDWRGGQLLYDNRQGFLPRFSLGASDVMGNHRLSLFMDKSSAISNSTDFMLRYLYLTKRPSYGLAAFNLSDYFFTQSGEYLETESGLTAYFDYALDKFRRIEAGFTSEVRTKRFFEQDREKERKAINFISLSLVEDTAIWGYSGPLRGSRCRLTIEHTLPFLYKRDLTNLRLDLRRYLKIGQESSLCCRLLAKGSWSRDEDRMSFPLGGIGFPIGGDGVDIRQEGDLRGYKEQAWGNYLLLTNLELRTPFIKLIYFALPLTVRDIRTVFFFDLGGVWNKGQNLTIKDKLNDKLKPTDLRGGIGLGLRLVLGMFPLRLDYAWPIRGKGEIDNRAISHFSLGYDF